ncbi:kinase-like domain-containing protein [Xylariaceae sp. FL0804]|nr:kinase-like domain-containing protein [Xylariaceae sp. FL0804]
MSLSRVCIPRALRSISASSLQRLEAIYPGSPRSRGSTIFSRSNHVQPFAPGTLIRGDSGRDYEIEEVLSDRRFPGSRNPLLCVYRARAEEAKYIAKNLIKGEYQYQMDLQKSVSSSPNVRTVVDANQELDIFFYPFLNDNLLHISAKKLQVEARKNILRSALHGLVALHESSILHRDIKPNNILIDYEEGTGGDAVAKSVQIADLEDGVLVPPGKWLSGALSGNMLWRSPESWTRSHQNTASDVFSFGIVMIYVMRNEMVFLVPDDQLHAEDSWGYILWRHIAFFGDMDGFNGYMEFIGEGNPFDQRMNDIASSVLPKYWKPFDSWDDVDPIFGDLVMKMTRLDPRLRITAKEALDHPWFKPA